MKYYKDENNAVYAFEADGSQDDFIGEHLIAITEAEANLIINPAKSVVELKQLRLAGINTDFEKTISNVISGIPALERESWKKQEDEARAYQANNAADTPLIDALASSRGINKAELVTRIIAKADLFASISGTLIGRRQSLEDTLDALPATATPEEIAAIVW